MARINLEMPKTYFAQLSIPVRITDINYGNHVGNDSFVSLIHEARMQWLGMHGYSELQAAGIGLIMSELVIEYKLEAVYGDTILFEIGAGDQTMVSFELYYKMSTIRNDQKVLLANARTCIVGYDYTAKKVVTIPEALKSIIAA